MTHQKDGVMIITVKKGDEFWIGPVRVIIKEKNRIAIQAPKDLKIETIQPWRKRGGE